MFIDNEAYESEDESTYSFTTCANIQNEKTAVEQIQTKVTDGDLGDFLDPNRNLACQTKKIDPFALKTRPASSKKTPIDQSPKPNPCLQCKDSPEQLYHVNYV